MDVIDVKILKALQENSRESASSLTEKVNLSVSAVIERIKKLESSGVIKQYSIILDPKLIGLDVTAFISILMEHPRHNDELIRFARENPAVMECHYIAGDFDFLIKVVTDSTRSLEEILNQVKGVSGVGRTKTTLVLSTPKQTHSCEIKEE